MRNAMNVFHLSIPCRNFEEEKKFYVSFFLRDPSNNLIEFRYYDHSEFVC